MRQMLPVGHIVGVSKAHTFWQHDAAFTGGVAPGKRHEHQPAGSRPTVYRARRDAVLLGAVGLASS